MVERLRIPDEKLYKYSFYKAGTVLFKQGDPGTDIYIMKRGAVTVTVDDQIVGLINTPDTMIGEMAYLLRVPRTATVEAIEDAEFIVIPGKYLYENVMKTPELGIDLLKILSRRLANTTKYATTLEKEVVEYRNEIRNLKGMDELQQPTLEEELLMQGFITEEKLNKCREEFKKLKKKGEGPSLLQIIIQNGYVTAEQLIQYLDMKQVR
jgi:CRP/FNR family transcriptional regulator